MTSKDPSESPGVGRQAEICLPTGEARAPIELQRRLDEMFLLRHAEALFAAAFGKRPPEYFC